MVTETINKEDIDGYNMNINNWIIDGISTDAIQICRDKWNALPGNNYTCSFKVRNKMDIDDINQLNRW